MTTDDDNPAYAAVWTRYQGRCVRCWGEAEGVHELVPRSQDPAGWQDPDNRVTLCRRCHYWAQHEVGWKAARPVLIEAARVLAEFYRDV